MSESRMSELIPLLKNLENKLNRGLIILETGCIRNINNPIGDGHSTKWIAEFVKNSEYKHIFSSIDLDTTNCEKYLIELKLIDYVFLVKGNSLNMLEFWNAPLDFLLLDSDNNADVILSEFKLLETYIQQHTIICIDDAKNVGNWKKGKNIVPYLINLGYNISWIQDRIAVFNEKISVN